MPDALLAARYEQLAASAAEGVDSAALQCEIQTLQRQPGGAIALPFKEPWRSIRLVVAPVRLPGTLDGAVAAAKRAALGCLRSVDDADVFHTPKAQLHVTLHHFGRPGPGGPRPVDDEALAAELAAVRQLVTRTPPFCLTVERLLLSNTGVLLLLYQTDDGAPFALRASLRRAFPASPGKQAVILHSSLARLLTTPPLEELQALRAVCEEATAALRGQRVPFDALWYVVERALPIDGDVTELVLGGSE